MPTGGEVTWEYTQMACDAWQMSQLASKWGAEYGWEVVAVVPVPAFRQVPKKVGDDRGETYEAVAPVEVLFRRQQDVELCGHRRGIVQMADHAIHAYDGTRCDRPGE